MTNPDSMRDATRIGTVGKQPNKNPAAPVQHLPPSKRDVLHSLMTQTATGKYGWRYEEIRPLLMPPVLGHGVMADCSYGVTILCHWAGLPDPTGFNYNGYGNSVSIFHHLPHVAVKDAKVGDILLFGPEGEWHATMIYTPGLIPVLWSFGHQGAPNLYSLSADPRKPVTACRIAAP